MNTTVRLLPALVVLLSLIAVAVSFAEQAENSIFCPACGTELPSNATFCTHCGAKLPQRVPPKELEETAPPIPAPTEAPTPAPEPPAGRVPPTVRKPPDIATQMRAEAVFDHAKGFFANGQYMLAADAFRQVVDQYPGTRCADAASVMTEACLVMATVDRERLTRPPEVKGEASALGQGFVGGCLGVGAALALLAALVGAAN